jgi:hypothetical protein
MDRHDIQSFEPTALCSLQEGATLISIQRPDLLAFDSRRINVVCYVAAHNTPPSGLFEGAVQHGMSVLDGPGTARPRSCTSRYIPWTCMAERLFRFTPPMAGIT